MISNKKWQQLLALATTGEKLPNDATDEEKEAYESLVRDHKIMLETAEKHGIKNPEMYILLKLRVISYERTKWT